MTACELSLGHMRGSVTECSWNTEQENREMNVPLQRCQRFCLCLRSDGKTFFFFLSKRCWRNWYLWFENDCLGYSVTHKLERVRSRPSYKWPKEDLSIVTASFQRLVAMRSQDGIFLLHGVSPKKQHLALIIFPIMFK